MLKGDKDEVLRIYDTQIAKRSKSCAMLDVVDNTSLLYRMKLEGDAIIFTFICIIPWFFRWRNGAWGSMARCFWTLLATRGWPNHVFQRHSLCDGIFERWKWSNVWKTAWFNQGLPWVTTWSVHQRWFQIWLFFRKPQSVETSYRNSSRVGLGILDAMKAFEEKRFEDAVEVLYPIRHRITNIGGSNAQVNI